MLKVNRTKALLAQGQVVYGTACTGVRSPTWAQIAAGAGFDYLMIDAEHHPWSLETLAEVCRTSRAKDITPIVRLPDALPDWISRCLDLGAEGVVLPRVENPDTVALAVERMKYPPQGRRGLSTGGGHSDYLGTADPAGFIAHMNENTMLVIQIETAAAVERADEILAAGGVDAVMVGPMDLTLSLGVVGQIHHARMDEAMTAILRACERAGVASGFHTTDVEFLRKWRRAGARFLTFGSDLGFLTSAARQACQAIRDSG